MTFEMTGPRWQRFVDPARGRFSHVRKSFAETKERLHIDVISLEEAVCRRGINPFQKLRIAGGICLA